MLEIHLRNGLAANDIATVPVGDREGIAAVSIPATKISFEVHAPNLIRGRNDCQRRTRRCYLLLRFCRVQQARSVQYSRDGTSGWPFSSTLRLFQASAELPCSPSGMLEPQFQNLFHDPIRCRMRTVLRSSVQLFQSRRSRFPKPLDPLIAGFPGNVIDLAKFCHVVTPLNMSAMNLILSSTIRLSFHRMQGIFRCCHLRF